MLCSWLEAKRRAQKCDIWIWKDELQNATITSIRNHDLEYKLDSIRYTEGTEGIYN